MWPFKRKRTVDPGRPHAYQATIDSGIAAVASGGPNVKSNIGDIAATSAYLRQDARCAVPGCGRPRDDDMHAVAG
ncbi:MAG: hypothetical protein ACM3H9_08330 [Rhodospirillaceae bacterium]